MNQFEQDVINRATVKLANAKTTFARGLFNHGKQYFMESIPNAMNVGGIIGGIGGGALAGGAAMMNGGDTSNVLNNAAVGGILGAGTGMVGGVGGHLLAHDLADRIVTRGGVMHNLNAMANNIRSGLKETVDEERQHWDGLNKA